MTTEMEDDLIDRLRAARRVTVLTGGALAMECGAPTFRQAQVDAWAEFEPQDLATINAFLRHPRRVWEWFEHRRTLLEQVKPGPAYYALVDLEQRLPQFMLITQAIDGLHWGAGSRQIIELHGNLKRYKCYEHGHAVDAWEDIGEVPPPCPRCKGPLRPDVVLFGEGVPHELINEAERAAASSEVFLCIGLGSVVQPASTLPLLAKRHGAFVIEISERPTTYSVFADHSIHGVCQQIVPELLAHIGADCDDGSPKDLPIFK